ncbi:hypothetical protein F441_06589 [Phytophthora nicotianae CJ01A1]|nr:hypothetical protein L915_06453 [Phytophthora nicotianae]ETL42928.1 hypothetical protein L916_06397 [Phytophthora nicotianae]ETL96105.1 hypothetical protein L917_06265 [Phytophthora nicotianae]ETO78347.1 hypothetical protein F444_06650 [Phytophthora nicotianae P1976]ETP19396.1 hypothetical protein F441_06589 [Phytophthora nicotianae CJ01A1]
MRAFAVCLAGHKNNVTVVIPPRKKYEEVTKGSKPRKTKSLIPASTLRKVAECVILHPFVLLPVIFGGTHWGCLVVDRDAKVVKMYDSMGGKRNKKRLQKMAEDISGRPLHDNSYEALEVSEPMQTDSDSCGAFVCLIFWTCVSSKAPSDVSPAEVDNGAFVVRHHERERRHNAAVITLEFS